MTDFETEFNSNISIDSSKLFDIFFEHNLTDNQLYKKLEAIHKLKRDAKTIEFMYKLNFYSPSIIAETPFYKSLNNDKKVSYLRYNDLYKSIYSDGYRTLERSSHKWVKIIEKYQHNPLILVSIFINVNRELYKELEVYFLSGYNTTMYEHNITFIYDNYKKYYNVPFYELEKEINCNNLHIIYHIYEHYKHKIFDVHVSKEHLKEVNDIINDNKPKEVNWHDFEIETDYKKGNSRQRFIFINELGILDLLKKEFAEPNGTVNQTKLAKALEYITGMGQLSNVNGYLSYSNKPKKNPYLSSDYSESNNVEKVRQIIKDIKD